jgi:hypothetical protein
VATVERARGTSEPHIKEGYIAVLQTTKVLRHLQAAGHGESIRQAGGSLQEAGLPPSAPQGIMELGGGKGEGLPQQLIDGAPRLGSCSP